MLLPHVAVILDAVGMGVPGLGLGYGETASGAALIHRQGDVDVRTHRSRTLRHRHIDTVSAHAMSEQSDRKRRPRQAFIRHSPMSGLYPLTLRRDR